jgi:hypothetical protein
MPSVATTPRRMETFARALDRAVASAIVPRAHIDQLRSAFIATDAQGRSWTIDPEFQRWGRLDGEVWMVDDPPPQLIMDSELRASLEALEAMAARAIVRGADALHAPSTPWFRTPAAPAEPPGMSASIPSRESATAPHPPLDREQAPLAEPARSSESMSPRASAASVETTPAPEPVPMLTVTPTRNSSMAGEPAPSVASRVAAQAATPVENTAPSRSAIPESYLRFAGPGIARASDDSATPTLAAMAAPDPAPAPDRMPASAKLPASAPPRDASHDHERWVPTSIAPRLTAEHREARDDRAHVFLCGLLAALFLALASWKGDGRGYAAALLFGLLTIALLVLNLAQSRHD